jgi:hypothetical protein
MRAFLIAAALAIAAAAPAAASSRHAGDLGGGPVLAGDRVVWAQQHGRSGLSVRSADASGAGPATTLLYSRESQSFLVPRARLAASGSLLGVERIIDYEGRREATAFYQADVLAGSSRGSITALQPRCDLGGEAWRPQTIDADGTQLMYWDCLQRTAVIRDFNAPTSRTVPAEHRGLRLAGGYAAWVEGDPGAQSVTVYDVPTSSVAYRVALPGAVADLDLDRDGMVVVSYSDGSGYHTAWASPSEPTLHSLPLPPVSALRVVAGRLAYRRAVGTYGQAGEVGYLDLPSGRAHVVGRGQMEWSVEPGLGFDGRRIAWDSIGCRDSLVHVTAVTEFTDELPRGCPLAFDPPVRVAPKRIRLELADFGYLHFTSVRKLRATHRGTLVAIGSKPEHLRMTSAGVRLLEQRGSLRVRIAATVNDTFGRTERRATRVILRV